MRSIPSEPEALRLYNSRVITAAGPVKMDSANKIPVTYHTFIIPSTF